MLQLRSFKMSDADGMNETLKMYRIAPGASIFVSNGEIVLPIEDGEPMNTAQEKIKITERKHDVLAKQFEVSVSQKIGLKKVNGIKTQIAELQEKQKEAHAKEKYDIGSEIRKLENVLEQTESSVINSQAQLTEYHLELQVLDDLLSEFKD